MKSIFLNDSPDASAKYQQYLSTYKSNNNTQPISYFNTQKIQQQQNKKSENSIVFNDPPRTPEIQRKNNDMITENSNQQATPHQQIQESLEQIEKLKHSLLIDNKNSSDQKSNIVESFFENKNLKTEEYDEIKYGLNSASKKQIKYDINNENKQNSAQKPLRTVFDHANQSQIQNQNQSINQSNVTVFKLNSHRNQNEGNSLKELVNNLNRVKINAERDINQLLKDNDVLRLQLSSYEINKQNEINNLKEKYELINQANIDNLKSNLCSQLVLKEEEIIKLKNILDMKNQEINALNAQNAQVKSLYHEQNQSLKENIYFLKQNLIENENIKAFENEEIINNIKQMHNDELVAAQEKYFYHVRSIEDEIQTLKKIIDSKNEELDIQRRQKEEMQITYEKEYANLKNMYSQAQLNMELIEKELLKKEHQYNVKLERETFNFNQEIQLVKQQVNVNETELNNVRNIVHQKNQEIQFNQNKYSQHLAELQNDINSLQSRFREQQQYFESEIMQKDLFIQTLQQDLKSNENQFDEMQKQYEHIINHVTQEIKKLQENIIIKQRECDNVYQQRKQIELQNTSYQTEIQLLSQQLFQQEQQKQREIEEIKTRIEETNIYQIENLKAAYNTQIQILQEQLKDLEMAYQSKSQQYQDAIFYTERSRTPTNQKIQLNSVQNTYRSLSYSRQN